MLEELQNPQSDSADPFANLYKIEDELCNQTGISESELVEAIKSWKLEDDQEYKEMIQDQISSKMKIIASIKENLKNWLKV